MRVAGREARTMQFLAVSPCIYAHVLRACDFEPRFAWGPAIGGLGPVLAAPPSECPILAGTSSPRGSTAAPGSFLSTAGGACPHVPHRRPPPPITARLRAPPPTADRYHPQTEVVPTLACHRRGAHLLRGFIRPRLGRQPCTTRWMRTSSSLRLPGARSRFGERRAVLEVRECSVRERVGVS